VDLATTSNKHTSKSPHPINKYRLWNNGGFRKLIYLICRCFRTPPQIVIYAQPTRKRFYLWYAFWFSYRVPDIQTYNLKSLITITIL